MRPVFGERPKYGELPIFRIGVLKARPTLEVAHWQRQFDVSRAHQKEHCVVLCQIIEKLRKRAHWAAERTPGVTQGRGSRETPPAR